MATRPATKGALRRRAKRRAAGRRPGIVSACDKNQLLPGTRAMWACAAEFGPRRARERLRAGSDTATTRRPGRVVWRARKRAPGKLELDALAGGQIGPPGRELVVEICARPAARRLIETNRVQSASESAREAAPPAVAVWAEIFKKRPRAGSRPLSWPAGRPAAKRQWPAAGAWNFQQRALSRGLINRPDRFQARLMEFAAGRPAAGLPPAGRAGRPRDYARNASGARAPAGL